MSHPGRAIAIPAFAAAVVLSGCGTQAMHEIPVNKPHASASASPGAPDPIPQSVSFAGHPTRQVATQQFTMAKGKDETGFTLDVTLPPTGGKRYLASLVLALDSPALAKDCGSAGAVITAQPSVTGGKFSLSPMGTGEPDTVYTAKGEVTRLGGTTLNPFISVTPALSIGTNGTNTVVVTWKGTVTRTPTVRKPGGTDSYQPPNGAAACGDLTLTANGLASDPLKGK